MKTRYMIAAASALLLLAGCAREMDIQTPGSSVLKAVIEQSEKISFPAVITDTLGRMERDFSYSITPTRLHSIYEPTRIKAARIIGEPATKLYNNYFRLGVGYYPSTLADLYWSSTRDREKTYGIRVNHNFSWGSIPDYGKNFFGQTAVTLFGKYIIADKLQLSTDISYEHDHNLYYGFSDSTLQAVLGTVRDSIALSDYRASYNIATWNIGLKSMQLDPNKLGYALNVHASDLWAYWGQNEFNLNASGDIHYGFNIKDQYKGVAYLRVEFDGYRNSYRLDGEMPLGCSLTPQADTVVGWRNIVKVNPYADFMLSGLDFHVGLTAGWDSYTSDTATTFRLFPDVVVSKSLMKDALVLSLGATGGFDANNWNTIRLVNPYIAPDAEQRATRHYDFTFHARWNPSRKIEVNAEAGFQMLQDDLTFTLDNDYTLNNLYRPMYVDDNRFNIGGTVSFVNDEMLTLMAGGHYYRYTFVDEKDPLAMPTIDYVKPLYRPDWDAIVAAKVNYHDKWLFYLEGQLLGNMRGDLGETLPMRYGIAAEVEYRHNRALSFFLKMDNLAFQRYNLWTNYPSQRGLFILGLTYTIPHK